MVALVLSFVSYAFPRTNVIFREALREKQLKSLNLCCSPSCEHSCLSCHIFWHTYVKGFNHICRMVEEEEVLNSRARTRA